MFGLIRLIIMVLVALSLFRAVVNFVQKFLGSGQRQNPLPQQRTAPPTPVSTMLQQDPVCGTYVSVESSLKRIVGGRVLHFCSAECRDRYPA